MKKNINLFLIIVTSILFTGCLNNSLNNSQVNELISKKSQLDTRSMQTQQFNDVNKTDLQKAIVNTLQDESLSIQDFEDNFISAQGYKNNLELLMQISIFDKENDIFDVRISINVKNQKAHSSTINGYYPYLFERLKKSIFLEQNLYNKFEDDNLTVEETGENTNMNKMDTLPNNENKIEKKSTRLDYYNNYKLKRAALYRKSQQ